MKIVLECSTAAEEKEVHLCHLSLCKCFALGEKGPRARASQRLPTLVSGLPVGRFLARRLHHPLCPLYRWYCRQPAFLDPAWHERGVLRMGSAWKIVERSLTEAFLTALLLLNYKIQFLFS
jgi:hypothetical protein